MKNIKLLFVFLFLQVSATMWTQVHNKGVLFVDNNAEIYINGIFDFTTPATETKTSRGTDNGVISLSAAALNASTASNLNFVDGFVQIYPSASPAEYTFPIGFGTTYGPIAISASNQQPISSAYFLGDVNSIGPLNAEVDKISTTEFWNVTSNNIGKVTLYWNEGSDISAILGLKVADYLTIVGFDGANWVVIDTQLDLVLQSMTTTENINLQTYSSFAIGARKDLVCYTPVQSSGNTKTWNGTSWYPSNPGITDPVVIASALTLTTNLECYSVTLNHDITMTGGQKLMVVNGFDGPGKIIMSNLSSVVQQNPTATAPQIEMTRIVPQMRRYDYVFLSNPTTGTSSFFTQLLNNQNVATNGNFGVQPNSAFLQLRTFDVAGLTATDATAANTPVGRGFSATVRSQAPYSISNAPEAWYTEKENIHIKIKGITNNGRYNVTLPAVNGYMRLGNPYPSPINGKKIWEITEGLVDKTMYYWTYNTQRGTLAPNTYNSGDFATYNLQGGTAASTGGIIPDGTIAPMQSVLIKSVAPSATVIIDNCVRFFEPPLYKRAAQEDSNGKFRINLQGSINSFSQILVAYDAENGTLGYDNGHDSQRLVGNLSELSSLIDNQRYTIQTRPAFTVEDVVPLQFDNRTNETFSIRLATTEGVFENTPIILHDKTLEIYHNLSANDYSFAQSTADDEMRFDILYDNTVLNNSDFKLREAFAFISLNQFRAQANSSITQIQIYDMAGRLIINYLNLDTQNFSSDFDKAKGIYIAKITLADGTIVNQKIVNQ
jgi:hypothetical protein